MIDNINTPDQEEARIKTRAREMIKRTFFERLRLAGASEQVVTTAAPLTEMLEKILKRPRDMEHWGDDINYKFPKKGSEVTLIGLSAEGVLRPPRSVALRKPSDFLRILEEYLNTGDISAELLVTPEYDPTISSDDEEDYLGTIRAESIVSESARVVLNGIAEAKEFDDCVRLQFATQFDSAHNMRLYGVLAALDKKTSEIVTKEIDGAETQEQFATAEEHVQTFPFDDETVRENLKQLLEIRRHAGGQQIPDAEFPPYEPSPLEIRATELRTLSELAQVARDAATGGDQKLQKNIDTLANVIVAEECMRVTSLDDFLRIRSEAQAFPFSSEEYGRNVLEKIERKAKYFALAEIIMTPFSELHAFEPKFEKFPFMHKENFDDLRLAIKQKRDANNNADIRAVFTKFPPERR